jgi:hypothetical protein
VLSRRSGSSPDRRAERQHRHKTPWNHLERRGTAFVFCCKLETPWDRRPLKNAVGTPCNRRDNAVQSPTTSWHRSESVVRSLWERQGGRKRLHGDCTTILPPLHSVYGAFMAIPKRLHYDPTEFSRRLHSVHAAFLAIPKRLHYDPTEFSRRLLNKQINNTHVYMYL